MNIKLKQIIDTGLENLQVVLDFDRTITGPYDGKPAPSMISFLRESEMLGQEYAGLAQDNFKRWHPIETDPDVDDETKTSEMHAWWKAHLSLVKKYGLTLDKIRCIVNHEELILRNGVQDFLNFCREKNIPVIIFSANVMGRESIEMFFQRFGVDTSGIKIITNELVFDDTGKVVGFKEPIIHSENKSEEVFEVEGVEQRQNTILAGDGTGDAKMILDKPGSLVYRYAVLDNATEEIKNKYLVSFDEVVSDFSAILSELKRGDEKNVEVGRLK